MPRHEHCPSAKRREDRNPKCHEEQQKDVIARNIAALSQKRRRKGKHFKLGKEKREKPKPDEEQ
jgi:ribosomal protein S4